MGGVEDAADILRMAASDPRGAADRLDEMADRLKAAAARLRALADEQPGVVAQPGASDRVMMRVLGPDGRVKYQTDTGSLEIYP